MAEDQPSLTPHRDCAETLIQRMDAADNFIEEISNAVTVAVHRAIADQRDRGVSQQELLEHLPKWVRACAINGLAAIGAKEPLAGAPVICVQASMPAAAPDGVHLSSSPIDRRAVGGGRA